MSSCCFTSVIVLESQSQLSCCKQTGSALFANFVQRNNFKLFFNINMQNSYPNALFCYSQQCISQFYRMEWLNKAKVLNHFHILLQIQLLSAALTLLLMQSFRQAMTQTHKKPHNNSFDKSQITDKIVPIKTSPIQRTGAP